MVKSSPLAHPAQEATPEWLHLEDQPSARALRCRFRRRSMSNVAMILPRAIPRTIILLYSCDFLMETAALMKRHFFVANHLRTHQVSGENSLGVLFLNGNHFLRVPFENSAPIPVMFFLFAPISYVEFYSLALLAPKHQNMFNCLPGFDFAPPRWQC